MVIRDDLEIDGNSDFIYTCDNTIGTAALCVRHFPMNKVYEWDFRGSFAYIRKNCLITGDCDGNSRRWGIQ